MERTLERIMDHITNYRLDACMDTAPKSFEEYDRFHDAGVKTAETWQESPADLVRFVQGIDSIGRPMPSDLAKRAYLFGVTQQVMSAERSNILDLADSNRNIGDALLDRYVALGTDPQFNSTVKKILREQVSWYSTKIPGLEGELSERRRTQRLPRITHLDAIGSYLGRIQTILGEPVPMIATIKRITSDSKTARFEHDQRIDALRKQYGSTD